MIARLMTRCRWLGSHHFFKPIAAIGLGIVVTASACAKPGFPADQVDQFVERMQTHGFSEAETRQLIAAADHKQAIIDAISRPAEGVLHWHKYRQISLNQPVSKPALPFGKSTPLRSPEPSSNLVYRLNILWPLLV